MSTAIWTLLTIGALAALFGTCVVAVVAGVRVLERGLAKRAGKPTA